MISFWFFHSVRPGGSRFAGTRHPPRHGASWPAPAGCYTTWVEPNDTNPSIAHGAPRAGESTASQRRIASFAIFACGTAIMTFVHGGVGWPGDTLGAPGRDSFYHVKMAALIPEVGLLDKMDWLQHVYFTETDDRFVSHHYGFHVLLVPFVTASHWLTGSYLPGGRWFVAVCFGLNFMLLDRILAQQRVRCRWLWLILFLFLPYQFYTRHAYIRAIGPSLVLMQALMLAIFSRRFALSGLLVALYVHLYLGGVLYAPVIVVACVVATIVGPAGDRHMPWRLIAWTLAGWLIGILIHPYRHGMIEFLQMQVFGSGLSPDIAVGREWKPYSDAWFIVEMSAPLVLLWAGALFLRCRVGPRLSVPESAVLLLGFAFLGLTLKARRFIEYWPMFALISAALLARPVLDSWVTAWGEWRHRLGVHERRLLDAGAVASSLTAAILLACRGPLSTDHSGAMIALWPLWLGCTCLYLIATGPGMPVATGRHLFAARAVQLAAVAIAYVVGLGLILTLAIRQGPGLPPSFSASIWVWLVMAFLVSTSVVVLACRAGDNRVVPAPDVVLGSARSTAICMCLTVALLVPGDAFWSAIQHASRCQLDLRSIEDVMTAVADDAEPGDIIFTDDWDIFPPFFYFNTHNRYIVGLDPKFTQARDPQLWARYVKISRGNAPAKTSYTTTAEDGTEVKATIQVDLQDIVDHFHARYVVTDSEHTALARKLAAAADFAELIYPVGSYNDVRHAPYLAFRINDPESESQP